MQVAYLLYDQMTALDITGPYEVLAAIPGTDSVFVAERKGSVRDERGALALVAECTLDEVPAPDVVVVPGGFGTRVLLKRDPVLVWLRKVHETSSWTASVCLGSLLLAAAGLLNDVPATTHWLGQEELASLGARPVRERVVQSGKIITAAGVSSGIDMALRLVALMHGPDLAQAIQLGIEYDPAPPFDSGAPEKAPAPIVEAVTAAFNAMQAQVLQTAANSESSWLNNKTREPPSTPGRFRASNQRPDRDGDEASRRRSRLESVASSQRPKSSLLVREVAQTGSDQQHGAGQPLRPSLERLVERHGRSTPL